MRGQQLSKLSLCGCVLHPYDLSLDDIVELNFAVTLCCSRTHATTPLPIFYIVCDFEQLPKYLKHCQSI